MSFIIRTVSRTADGREIVRPVTLAKPVIAIGRDASNDIHLADLAVEPFHARLTMMPNGRVRAESIGGLGFAVDGRTSQLSDINPATGAELRFGGHLLTVSSEGGTAVVRVERTEAVSDAAGDKDERTAFTLAGLLPGKRTGAWTFALLILAAFLIAPLWSWATYSTAKTRPAGFHADTAWSSGPLSKAHHALEGNCQSCHDKAFTSVEDSKCVACHTGIHDHADPRRQVTAMAPPGFGKSVGNAFKVAFGKPTGQRCVDCHSEHEGAGPMPATAQAFCTDCHATMKGRLPDTKLENTGDFGTAHPQFRPAVVLDTSGAQPRIQRVSLDAKPLEDNGLKFPHDVHLSKVNGVARMAQTMRAEQGWGASLDCKDCHTPTADGVRFLPVDMERNCQMCHSLGYDRVGGTVRTLKHGNVAQAVADVRALGWRPTLPPSMLAGRRRPGEAAPASQGATPVSVDALFTKGGACFDCHVIDRAGDASTNGWRVRPVVQPMRYMMKGWFDHKAHATESCASCHAASTSKSASDLLIPGIGKLGDKGGATCRSCHGGEASASKVPSSCATCHDYHLDGQAPWRPTGVRPRVVAIAEPRKP
jgi:predicted CXXCH cytochrome family protein